MSDEHAPAAQGAHAEQHLPHGSRWPFWLANAIALVTIALIMVGRALNLNGGEPSTITMPVAFGFVVLAVVALVGTLLGWIRQDMKWWRENVGTGNHIPKAGILLFIGSEVFLFGALFATYFSFKTISPEWPDTDVTL